jgi:hypothetical protein
MDVDLEADIYDLVSMPVFPWKVRENDMIIPSGW